MQSVSRLRQAMNFQRLLRHKRKLKQRMTALKSSANKGSFGSSGSGSVEITVAGGFQNFEVKAEGGGGPGMG